ncbi:MAG: FAD-binding protein, partial [Arsenicicoccus sp.]
MGRTPGRTWAGTFSYSAAELVEPRSVEEVAEVMGRAERVRLLGSRHSFNRIAD